MAVPIEWAERYRREKYGYGFLVLSGENVYYARMNSSRDIVHENDDNSKMPSWFRAYKEESEQWRRATDAQIMGLQEQLNILMFPYRKALNALKWSGVIIAGGVLTEAVHRCWDFIVRHVK